jgi:hypothetical protein
MQSAMLLPTYDEFMDYLIEKATPEEILAFQPSDESLEYVQDLITRHHNNEITAEESKLLEQMLHYERLLAVLKAKAFAAATR